MSVVTVRISPPRPPKSKRSKNAAPTPREELERLFLAHKIRIIPFVLALWLACVAAILGTNPLAPVYVGGALALIEFLIWWQGHRVGAIRREERAYAFALPAVGALWILFATAAGHSDPSAFWYGLLVVLTASCAYPWWRHRRVRESVAIRFEHISRLERAVRMKEVMRLRNDWTKFTSAGHVQSARLLGIDFTKWSVSLHVRLRNGAHATELQRPSRRRHLESASLWPVGEGSVRIKAWRNDSRNCTIRFMLRDPHAEAFMPEDDETPTIENASIGLFETGAEVFFALVNTLVAGETGAGKSNLLNRIIHVFGKIPTVGLLGIDAAPGMTEFRPWKDVFHVVANSSVEIDTLFDSILAEMNRRGEIMSERGWKNWRCTVRDPWILLIVDEVQRVKQMRLMGKLEDIVANIRKYGGSVVVATQYPTSTNVTRTIMANCPQRIGLRTDGDVADRVIFGNNANKSGWSPSVLIPADRLGSFLIRSPLYGEPLLARCHFMTEALVEREAKKWSVHKTEIPTVKLQPIESVKRVQFDRGDEPAELEDTVDAEVVDSVEGLVLDLIEREINTPAKIQRELEQYGHKVTVRTINRHIKSLSERKLIKQLRAKGPWYRA